MRYVVPPHPIQSIAVKGTEDRFPVRRIYTIGRNYAAHAAETGLGGQAGSVPGVSLKPTDSLLTEAALPYPPATNQLEPEVELVVAIGTGGADIAPASALDHVFGYAVGFDMIRRDVLQACIRNQHSWDLCKSFAGASPVCPIVTVRETGHPARGAITLDVNGTRRQSGDLADLIWPPAEIIARLSAMSRLEPGDIIFTGTPKGPQPVVCGDRLHGRIEGVGELKLAIL